MCVCVCVSKQISGFDATNTAENPAAKIMIENHFRKIRSIDVYRYSLIIVYIEANNNRLLANEYANVLRQPFLGPIEIRSEDPKGYGRDGIWIDAENKLRYIENLRRVIANGELDFAEHSRFVSVTAPDARDSSVTSGVVTEKNSGLYFYRQQFCAQLGVFRKRFKPVNDIELAEQPKYVLTGKSAGKKDDLVSAAGIVAWKLMEQIVDSEFVERAIQKGWRL